MSDIIIKNISDEYIDEVLKINSLSFKDPWSKSSFTKELENKFAHYIVALRDNLVVGYAGIWAILDEAHIISIAVHPDYRGLDISVHLMNGILNLCKTIGVKELTLEVRTSNTIAQNLYKKFNFKEEGIRKKYYPDGEDGLIMWNRNL
ncbi:ribosomal protein S18-alanine N-acetyltransferase [Haloimpatiens lingqiaonensis]|uniref:ribosomal protein S18-alanine N-acetyltransferase n=1 Tax=Haloimpatiens lingqiaonensis TaxID=1380675 RepID=UPI0037C0C7D2